MKANFTKHIPLRTCVACREVKTKRELVRLVRLADGSVAVDSSGRQAGRGAYLCRAPQCWQDRLKAARLGYVLRTNISRENLEQLIEYGKSLIGGLVSG
ncbi:MAG: YlxR family protein [Dehalococcoidales bacterium]